MDPSTILGAIFCGILAGIIAAFVVLLIQEGIKKIVLPWYQELVYKGVDLRGTWTSQRKYKNGIEYIYTLLLKQKAHNVNGTMSISKRNSKPGPPGKHLGDYEQVFNVEGVTWEGFVTLNMRSSDRRSLSFATSLLKVTNRGHCLVGHMAYRGSIVDNVGSEGIIWDRKM